MKKYIGLLLASRAAVYIVSLISSLLIDHGEQAFGLYEKMFAVRFPIIFKLLRPMVFYDGDFFFEIVLTGYNYDKIHAFFPGFPIAVKSVLEILAYIFPWVDKPLLAIFAAWILNFLFSIFTIWMLSKIFEKIPSIEPRLKDLTLKILIINPTSVYLSSFYSEAMFLCIQVCGLFIISNELSNGSFRFSRAMMAMIVFALGGFVRSNGFLSGGFVIYFYLIYHLQQKFFAVFKCLIAMCLFILVSVIPFVIVQYTGYRTLCYRSNTDYEFCSRRFPLVYNFIQKKYWDVEFMSAIEGRRLINFFYVLPIFAILLVYGAEKLRLGSFKSRMFNLFRLNKVKDLEDFLVPSFYLFLILILFGMTVMHYNSFTRLLAGYPLFYIFLAELYLSSGSVMQKILRFWVGPFQIFVTVFAVNNYLPI
jgi:phosphatidylinositol glycan class V